MFANSFLQTGMHISQKAIFKHALEDRPAILTRVPARKERSGKK